MTPHARKSTPRRMPDSWSRVGGPTKRSRVLSSMKTVAICLAAIATACISIISAAISSPSSSEDERTPAVGPRVNVHRPRPRDRAGQSAAGESR